MLGTAVKMILGCLVSWLGMNLVLHEVAAHRDDLLAFDSHLPGTFEQHTWKPGPRGEQRLRFYNAKVVLPRCHNAVLGSYSVRIDGVFHFAPAAAGLPTACDPHRLGAHLAGATKVDADRQDGHGSLTFSDGGQTVLVLRATR